MTVSHNYLDFDNYEFSINLVVNQRGRWVAGLWKFVANTLFCI